MNILPFVLEAHTKLRVNKVYNAALYLRGPRNSSRLPIDCVL
jgi:hypothetical protein